MPQTTLSFQASTISLKQFMPISFSINLPELFLNNETPFQNLPLASKNNLTPHSLAPPDPFIFITEAVSCLTISHPLRSSSTPQSQGFLPHVRICLSIISLKTIFLATL